jgi:peptide/nickel transport system substrate-binding protein
LPRLTAAAILIFALGCQARVKTPPDTLVVALSAAPATLDPRYATDATGDRLVSLVFSSLVRLGPNLEAVPEAAEHWTCASQTCTFYLRPDLRFNNGRPMNAEDVRYSFAQIASKSSPFSSLGDSLEKVEVREAGGRIIVGIQLKGIPDKFIRSELHSLKLLPKPEVEAASADFARHLIGSGPYRVVRQDMNEIEMEAVHAAGPRLLFKVIHDDFTRYQKLLKGEVDIAQGEIGTDRVGDFEKRPDEFQVTTTPTLNMTYLLVNFRDPVLRQKAAREALAHAIARAEIIRYKANGHAREATSILAPELPYHNGRLKSVGYDLDSARRLVNEAGVGGQKLILKTSNVPSAIDHGKVLAYQMSRSGLDVQVQSYEWGTFYGDVKRGNFQLATMTWVGIIDPDIYKFAFHSREKPPGRNRGFYENPALDALLEKGSNELSFTKRKKIFDEVQEIVHNDLAIIPLWYEQRTSIARRTVKNYVPTQTGDYWPLVQAKKQQ